MMEYENSNKRTTTRKGSKTMDGKTVVVMAVLSVSAMIAGAEDFKIVGRIKARNVTEISTSHWSIDCGGTDREHCDYHSVKEYLAPLGIKRVRTQAGWARCEKDKGKFDFRWLDSIVFDADRRGLEVWLELSYGNPNYPNGGGRGLGDGMPSSDEALAAWDRWVGELVKRYKGKVRDWCIWNEPDLHGANGPKAQLGLALRSAEIIKRDIPDARIVACALCWANPAFLEEFLPALAKSGKAELFTWIAFHHYQMNPDDAYDGEIADGVRMMKKYTPHLRYWQNESGTMSERGPAGALHEHDWTEKTQAKWNLRRYLADIGLGYDTAVFHICDLEYVNSGFHDGLLRYGLLKTAGQVDCFRVEKTKMAYYAVQNAVSVFNDAVVTVPVAESGMKLEGLKRPALYSFRAVKTGTGIALFWDASGIPSDEDRFTEVAVSIPGKKFEKPVLVDVLSGTIFAIPPQCIKTCDGSVEYTVPAFDSPRFITDGCEPAGVLLN